MTLWCVKGGRRGEREPRMLENGVIAIGWENLGDMSEINSKEELETTIRAQYPEANKHRVANYTGQVWAFIDRMKEGDLVVVPLKKQSAIAIGKIKSDYIYDGSLGEDMMHQRKVEWLKQEIPRTEFNQDLLYSFGAFMTVCQVTRNNAEERVKAVLKGETLSAMDEVAADETTATIDIGAMAEDEIEKSIGRQFRGHQLTELVEAILKAKGFTTKRSDPGPDRGVDILAGSGPMGFDEPRICVQVKSSESSTDVKVFRELKGTMRDFKATQGLLVSWGGFKSTVYKESEPDFFNIRFWDSKVLIEQVKRHYDDLPDTIQAKIPLERTWILAESIDEE